MIYQLLIEDPEATPVSHWDKVPFLNEEKVIEFKPGLNIVLGPNGTGKSTVIDGVARLLHCREQNWPVVTKASCDVFSRSDGILATGLTLVHDGQPARYLGIHSMAVVPEARAVTSVELAISENKATKGKALPKLSAGQASVAKLIRFLKHDAAKTRYKLKTADIGPSYKPVWEAAVASLKGGKAKTGAPKQQTILLDEIEANLDFAHQAMVWKTLRALVEDGKHQVIVASHSAFAINVPGAHYIETSPGYLEASRAALRLLHEEDEEEVKPRKRSAG
jgi:energy-coupling factor transporter ATP-binding protein EcfA2